MSHSFQLLLSQSLLTENTYRKLSILCLHLKSTGEDQGFQKTRIQSFSLSFIAVFLFDYKSQLFLALKLATVRVWKRSLKSNKIFSDAVCFDSDKEQCLHILKKKKSLPLRSRRGQVAAQNCSENFVLVPQALCPVGSPSRPSRQRPAHGFLNGAAGCLPARPDRPATPQLSHRPLMVLRWLRFVPRVWISLHLPLRNPSHPVDLPAHPVPVRAG